MRWVCARMHIAARMHPFERVLAHMRLSEVLHGVDVRAACACARADDACHDLSAAAAAHAAVIASACGGRGAGSAGFDPLRSDPHPQSPVTLHCTSTDSEASPMAGSRGSKLFRAVARCVSVRLPAAFYSDIYENSLTWLVLDGSA